MAALSLLLVGQVQATITPSSSALDIANAIATSSVTVTGASFDTVPGGTPNGTSTSALGGFPLDGASYGILTSGDVNSVASVGTFASSSDGASPTSGHSNYDTSILKVDLTVPAGANCLTFNFKFLSEEFPTFVGTTFNDAFIAELDANTWTTSGSTISAPDNFAFDTSHGVVSINSTGLGGMSAAAGAGTAFDGTASDGTHNAGGATTLLGAATPITAGAHSVYFSIFDQGDSSYDSAVFLDNLRTVSVVNPATDCVPGATSAAQLTLTKTVVGGSASASEWTLTADGPSSISGSTGDAAITNASVTPGTYSLGEAGPSGYSAGDWSCTGGGTLTDSSLQLGAGDSASCSITNTFIQTQAHVTLTKVLDNTGGGTAHATDWTLTADNPTPSGAPISGHTGDPEITNAPVDPGNYPLSESGGPSGYSASDWSCSGDGTLFNGSLAVDAGDTASCSITNTFIRPKLTLTKSVSGGPASVGDWTLSASGGPTPTSGHTGDAAVTDHAMDAGTYTLGEAGPSGYNASAWSCTGGLQVGSNITLAGGDVASCSITNTFIPPTLTLTKYVSGGGPASVGDWTLSASGGPTPTSGHTGDAAVTNHTMDAGTYTLGEAGPSGYNASAWSCTGGSLLGSSLTLAGGDVASCSITNTFIPPLPAHLTLVKSVVQTGGGTTDATVWTLTATGPTTISGHTGDAAVNNQAVTAGTYTLTESGGPPTGYHASAWTCTAGTVTGGNSLAIGAGQTATCTITNTFDASTNTSTTDTCPPTQTCTTAPITSPGVGTVVTITGAAGSTIVAEFDPFTTGTFVPCKDQKPRDPNNILSFDANTGTKTIQMTVNGKGPVPICWNSPTKFKVRDGDNAHFNSTLHVYYGLLPDCKGKHPVAPCVLSTVTTSPPPHHDEHHHPKPPPPPPPTTTVRILAPAGDPKLRA